MSVDHETYERGNTIIDDLKKRIAELEASTPCPALVDFKDRVCRALKGERERAEKAEAKPKRLREIIEAFDAARKYLVVGNYPLSEHCTCVKCKAIRLMDTYMEEQKAPTT